MTRTYLFPELFYAGEVHSDLKPYLREGLAPEFIPWLTFRGEHHFEAMAHGYPNGFQKLGTIRYSPEKIQLPISRTMLVFESSERKEGKAPRGFLNIGLVLISPLEELTDEEIYCDGFESKEDMLWQMTKMESRYYQDLTSSSIISYFLFGDLEPLVKDQTDSDTVRGALQEQLPQSWEELKHLDRVGWTKGW